MYSVYLLFAISKEVADLRSFDSKCDLLCIQQFIAFAAFAIVCGVKLVSQLFMLYTVNALGFMLPSG
jgi:hypothetical protein